MYTATFRKGTRLEIQRQIETAKATEEKNTWSTTLLRYQAETRRLLLCVSLVIECTIACLGLVRVFGALTVDELMVGSMHIAAIDAVDVVLTKWIIVGGSEGRDGVASALSATMSH